MKITTKAHYGLMAMCTLGAHYGQGPVSVREIAEHQHCSDSYMEQLIGMLRKAKLVKSVRGAQGGYILTKPPDEITAAEMFKALEGPLVFTECAADETSCSCTLECGCSSRFFWKDLHQHINDFLESRSLEDLMHDERSEGRPNGIDETRKYIDKQDN